MHRSSNIWRKSGQILYQMTFLSKDLFIAFFFSFFFLICYIKTTLWRIFCLGKNNLTTPKSLKNSHVRAKISNGYTGFYVCWGVNLAVSQRQLQLMGSQTGQWPCRLSFFYVLHQVTNGIQMNYYSQIFAPHMRAIAIRGSLDEENEITKSRVTWQDRDAKATAILEYSVRRANQDLHHYAWPTKWKKDFCLCLECSIQEQ